MPDVRPRRRARSRLRAFTGTAPTAPTALTALAAAALIALAAAGCGPTSASSDSSPGAHLALVAYSTPEPAFKKIIAAYQKTPQGRGVTFTESFGPSGSQASAVVSGQPAGVVNFSTEPDMAKLVKAGLVPPSWDTGPAKGMVTDSTVVFVVRKGNPEGIHSWSEASGSARPSPSTGSASTSPTAR